ncbi:MAG: tetratricopeptide repeat protein, partial [Candidatus Altiarchaeum hamiconexum]|nr:tetratricopeptide repeat protein [Candidatus Altarchaeum hamiconexum]
GLGNFRKAIEFYLKAEKIFEEIGQKHYLKFVYKNIAVVYEKMNDFEKAEKYKRKAEEI